MSVAIKKCSAASSVTPQNLSMRELNRRAKEDPEWARVYISKLDDPALDELDSFNPSSMYPFFGLLIVLEVVALALIIFADMDRQLAPLGILPSIGGLVSWTVAMSIRYGRAMELVGEEHEMREAKREKELATQRKTEKAEASAREVFKRLAGRLSLTELKCTSCGASLDPENTQSDGSIECEYCGTTYAVYKKTA